MKKRLLTILAIGIPMLFVADIASATSWSTQTSSTVTATNIGSLGGPGQTSGYGINNSGQVTGYSVPAGSDNSYAFVWNATKGMTDIGSLSSSRLSFVSGINNAGQVVGSSAATGGERHAFVWDATKGMTDLGTFGGYGGFGSGINDAGQVVGVRWSSKSGHIAKQLFSEAAVSRTPWD